MILVPSVLLQFMVVAETQVPATGNIWLSGMPSGSKASSNLDSAPAQSPAQFTTSGIVPGAFLRFLVSGDSTTAPGYPRVSAEGGDLVITKGTENGVSGITAPISGLIGVFLGDSPPNVSAVPESLDFSSEKSRDLEAISPKLGQVFFIGIGRTKQGNFKRFAVPGGASRLFLGVMDIGNFDNTGKISVQEVAPPSTFDFSKGLVAYYPFNGNANDESGNGNHGTVSGAQKTSDRHGSADASFHFNGAADQVNVPSTGLANVAAFTCTGWFLSDSNQTDYSELLQLANGGYAIIVRYELGQSQLAFVVGTGSHKYIYASPPSKGTWHQFGLVYDGSKIDAFLDGQLVASGPQSGAFRSSSASIHIGNWNGVEDSREKLTTSVSTITPCWVRKLRHSTEWNRRGARRQILTGDSSRIIHSTGMRMMRAGTAIMPRLSM
ncbi:MAG: LamG domain-containing protein [Verrucomicrobia bacterium]|nr:LamG domain-containing protein [Verrucomicrobiota bacterium]